MSAGKASAGAAPAAEAKAPAARRKTPAAAAPAARASTPPVPPAGELAKPVYWDDACRHLVKKDRILRKLIPCYAGMGLASRGDAFTTLARSIVGQQISVKAAAAVWARVELGVGAAAGTALTPAAVLAQQVTALRTLGLSQRKAKYLHDLARHFDAGLLNVAAWPEQDDEAIIAELVAVRGIGRWTAEMFLMFHLLRPDVLPLDDLGLIQGISRNYFSGEPVTRSDAREVAQAWKPYRSVATWYMWRSLAEPQAY